MGHSAVVWDYKAATEISKDLNGIDNVVLRSPRGASARVSLNGGQAIFKPPKAVHGGIPICFPQFGNCRSFEQHGFARNKIWIIDENPPPLDPDDFHGKSFIDLLLKPSEEDLKCWPHRFELGYMLTLTFVDFIKNQPCNGVKRMIVREQGDAITFESEVDRVYLSTPNVVAVLDHERKRTYVVRKEGLPDVVVWNPWEKKSKSMVDFGDDEYKQMLCIDREAGHLETW
ncbi:hypothetical protein PTKIN_Ptkin15bG0050000 [Pterospermum kingtungense]